MTNRVYTVKGGYVGFHCPGCDTNHVLRVEPCTGTHKEPVWNFNGQLDRPTFHPSIAVRSGHYSQFHKSGEHCWCTYEERLQEPSPFKCFICHSFVIDGNIQFLGDCTHALAGKTVPLPEVTE